MRFGGRRVLVVASAVLALWVLVLAPRGLFSGDSGVKLAQSHALWHSQFSTRALPMAPGLERYAAFRKFSFKVDGEGQGIYSIVFTGIAAPFIGLFGLFGMMLIGLAGGIALLFAVDRLAEHVGLSNRGRIAVTVVTVFATPLLFYSAQFTEHVPVVALSTWALVLVVQATPRPILAGALVGFAASMRPECYLACATIGFALVAHPGTTRRLLLRRGALYMVGALVILVPYWLVNLKISHSWDPLVTFQHAPPDRAVNIARLMVGDTTQVVYGWFVPIIAAVLAAFAPLRHRANARLVVGGLLVVLAVALLIVATGRTMVGMIAVTPIAAYGLVASVADPRWRAIWIYAVVTTIAILFTNNSIDAGGLQIGARLLLPVLPALVVLAAAVVEQDLHIRVLVAPMLLMALTLVAFARALPPAVQIASNGERAARAVSEAEPTYVIVRLWWEAQILAPALLDDKLILLPRTHETSPVLSALRINDVHRVTVINKGPLDINLGGGYHARDHAPVRNVWLEVHDVSIERP